MDRLSRSLLDFARMMELFYRHGVAFVSVTQLLLAIGRWLDAIPFQNVADRSIGDVITDIRQRALDAIAAPTRILLGESYDMIDDDLAYARTARSLFEVSHFCATSCRCQRRIVLGVNKVATSPSSLRPSDLPLTASRRR